MKVLHVVESLDRGAVENWLLRMLKFGRDRADQIDWTFYCTQSEPGRLDEQARGLGSRIVRSPVPLHRKSAFIKELRRELLAGQYDVLHCHHDLMSAVYLLASVGTSIRKRIVHVHNADEHVPTPNRVKAKFGRPLLRAICLAMADRVIGNSNHTLDTFLAGRLRRRQDGVLLYGVDSSPYRAMNHDRASFRRELGLSQETRILLFAGRMVPEKNPLFALEVFAELHRLDPTVTAVFAGTGSLDDALRKRASELGISSAFRQLGWRSDIPAVMSACDWFILPHPEHPVEGFGLAVVEAQLAGLRIQISEGVSLEPLLPRAQYVRLCLAEGPKAWAKAAIGLLDAPALASDAIFQDFDRSPMYMPRAMEHLLALYGDENMRSPHP